MYKGKTRLAARLLSIVLAAGMSVSGVSVSALAAEVSEEPAQQETVVTQEAAEEPETVPAAEEEETEEVTETEEDDFAEAGVDAEIPAEPEIEAAAVTEPEDEAEIPAEPETETEEEAVTLEGEAAPAAEVQNDPAASGGASREATHPKNGFYTDDNGDLYYYEDGELVCDRDFSVYDEENGCYYYYRAHEDGRLYVNEWFEGYWGTTYYYGNEGREVYGFVEIDGILYYFEEYGGLSKGGAYYDDNGDLYLVDPNGVATLSETENGWVETEDGNKYYLIDGTAAKGQVIEIDGELYGFDYSGYLMQDRAFELIKEYTINDLVYYRAHEDGHLYVNEWYREQYLDGNCDYYYYGEDGGAVSGLFEVAMPEETDAQLRCFEYDGKMMTNVFYTITSAEGNVTYSIDSNGVATEIPSSDPEYNEGWNEIDGSYKYVVDGEPVKDQVIWIEDEQTGEEKLYGFNGDGWMYSNTQFYLYDEWTGKEVYYCAHEDGHLYVNEWYDNPDNGFEYYYTEDGKAPTGLIELQERYGTEMVLYCFDQEGFLKRGGEYIDDDGYFYEISDGIATWAEERTGWYHDRYYNSYYIQNGRTVRNTVIYVEDEQSKYNWFGFRDDGKMYSNCPFSIEDEEGSISYYRAGRVLGRLFVNQWYEDEDNSEWYYYFDGGKAREGLQTIDGVMYVFAYDGRMLTDTTYTDENGVEYTVDNNGVATRVSSPEDNGYWDENGERYYIDGKPVCSAVIMIDGAYYGFNNSGYLYRDCYFDIWSEDGYSHESYYALEDGHLLVNDWWDQEDWGRTHYFGSDGREVSGFVEIDGALYYFDRYTGLARGGAFKDDNGDLYIVDKNGVATLVEAENGWIETEDGNKYYLIDGAAVKYQVIEIDGDYYGFDPDGLMYHDLVFNLYGYGLGPKIYCAGEDGKLITNTWYEDDFGEKYYFGDNAEAAKGMQEIDGSLYFFVDYSGWLLTDTFVWDEQGIIYYADSNGALTLVEGRNGWQELPDGNWSYFIDGNPVTNEVLKIGSKYYAFNSNGIMFTEGAFVIYYGELYFHFYRAKADGSLYVNEWYEDKDNSEWYYYFDKGEAKEGPQNVGGTTYIFTDQGKMMTSCTYTDEKTGNQYEVGSNGVARIVYAAKDGWNLIGGEYYYRENGTFIKHQVRKIGGSYYGFDYNGRMYDNQGFWIDAFYRAKKGGSLYVNEWYQEDDTNIWYYFGSDAKGAEGWKQIGNKWYYFEYGEMMTGPQWINGSTYFFDDNGAMVTGWQEDAGKWYYYDPSGAMATDWKKIGSTWYYFEEDGEMVTGLQEISGASYFFKDSGAMVTGWQEIEGSWYYFGSSGAMVKKNWQQSGNAWYYFDEYGEMVTGLQEIDGKIYFFKDSGAMVTGWQQVGDEWYYFESSGAAACSKWVGNYYMLASGVMATNQWVDNGRYYVGADGLWIPNYKEAI